MLDIHAGFWLGDSAAVVETTERLAQRILLALLAQPRPLNWFSNCSQRHALADLRAQRLATIKDGKGPNGTPDERLATLTEKGRRQARAIRRARIARNDRRRQRLQEQSS